MRYIIAIFIFCGFVSGCSNSEKDGNLASVDIPVKAAKEIQLSAVATSLDSIALETLDSNLLFRIVNVEHDQQSVFIADIDAVSKFSRDGKFIKKIGSKGQGPGEYLNITDIALDKEKSLLYVASGTSQKIVCSDLDGKFLRESKIRGLIGIKMIDGSIHGIFHNIGMPSKDASKWFNKSYLLKFDQDFSPSDTLLIKSVKAKKGSAGISNSQGDRVISEVNGDVYYYLSEVIEEPFVRDTLFQIKNNKSTSSLKLNFGIEDRTQEHFFVNSLVRTENHLVVDFKFENHSGMSIVGLSTNKAYVGKEYFQDDLWGTGSAKLIPWDLNKEEFYFIKEGMELVDKFDGLTGEENPFLFIVKLKTGSF